MIHPLLHFLETTTHILRSIADWRIFGANEDVPIWFRTPDGYISDD